MSESGNIRVRVAGIIVKDGRFLLIEHKKDNKTYWLFPGGGVDFGESLEDALKREIREELGVEVVVRDLVFASDSIDPEGARHILNICFMCNHLSGTFLVGDDPRLSNYGFFSPDEIDGMMIFPPFYDEIKKIMSKDSERTIYLGAKWVPL